MRCGMRELKAAARKRRMAEKGQEKETNMPAPCGACSLLLHSIFMYIPFLLKSAVSGHINQIGLIDKNPSNSSRAF